MRNAFTADCAIVSKNTLSVSPPAIAAFNVFLNALVNTCGPIASTMFLTTPGSGSNWDIASIATSSLENILYRSSLLISPVTICCPTDSLNTSFKLSPKLSYVDLLALPTPPKKLSKSASKSPVNSKSILAIVVNLVRPCLNTSVNGSSISFSIPVAMPEMPSVINSKLFSILLLPSTKPFMSSSVITSFTASYKGSRLSPKLLAIEPTASVASFSSDFTVSKNCFNLGLASKLSN